MTKILISGGGTGGHVYPAIAIADAIRSIAPDAELLFVGAQDKLEMERVPAAGYSIEGLPVAGFHRSLSWRNFKRNLSFPFKLAASYLRARAIVKRFAPDIAIGTGGYASGPVLRVAQSRGIPTLIQEQNSYPGVTNRLLAARASAICVAYPEMERFFPAEKIRFLGNPLRAQLAQADRETALAHFGLSPQKRTIAVLGGSLGARTLNQAMRDNVDFFEKNPDLQALWQCGKLYAEEYRNVRAAQLPQVKLLPFVERMDLLYAAADVIIARAGALTISELCAVGKPVVLVPSPNVAADHQTHNAQALAARGAALLTSDAEAPAHMLRLAAELLSDERRAASMGQKLRALARPNAAREIAAIALNLAQQQRHA
ncbi:MAG: undecaprenyldiphospho-muramoylpentapeptide beta-N-acetylglucosaminyltransferase [Saprospiraceae bacterium]